MNGKNIKFGYFCSKNQHKNNFNTRDKVRQRVQSTHNLIRTQSHVDPQKWNNDSSDTTTTIMQHWNACFILFHFKFTHLKNESSGQFNLFVYHIHCCHFHAMAHCVTVQFKVKYRHICVHLATQQWIKKSIHNSNSSLVLWTCTVLTRHPHHSIRSMLSFRQNAHVQCYILQILLLCSPRIFAYFINIFSIRRVYNKISSL